MNGIKHLRQMREWSSQNFALSGDQRRAVDRAIKSVENKWSAQHRESYETLLDTRKRERQTVRSGATEGISAIDELEADVEAGRLSPAEAMRELRKHMESHKALTDVYNGIMSREDELEAFADMTPDQFQAERLDRFPVVRETAPDLATLVNQELRAMQHSRDRRSDVDNSDQPSEDDLT